MKNKVLHISLQLIYWGFISIISVYFRKATYADLNDALLITIEEVISLGVLFYLNLLIFMPKVYGQKRIGRFLLFSLSSIIIFTWIRYQSEFIIPSEVSSAVSNYPKKAIWAKIMTSFIVTTTSSFYYLIFRYIQSKDEQIELLKIQQELELKLLKSRITPHFLFNTLGNLHSLAEKKSDQTGDMILKLSDLMRGVMQAGDKNYIPINDEVGYLKSYIALQQLKTQAKQNITLNVEGSTIGIQIPPLLFMSFLENSFKYSSIQDNGWIKVDIIVNNKDINFSISNDIDAKGLNSVILQSGFGLANIKSRLQLIYPDRHELIIKDLEKQFNVELNITSQRD